MLEKKLQRAEGECAELRSTLEEANGSQKGRIKAGNLIREADNLRSTNMRLKKELEENQNELKQLRKANDAAEKEITKMKKEEWTRKSRSQATTPMQSFEDLSAMTSTPVQKRYARSRSRIPSRAPTEAPEDAAATTPAQKAFSLRPSRFQTSTSTQASEALAPPPLPIRLPTRIAKLQPITPAEACEDLPAVASAASTPVQKQSSTKQSSVQQQSMHEDSELSELSDLNISGVASQRKGTSSSQNKSFSSRSTFVRTKISASTSKIPASTSKIAASTSSFLSRVPRDAPVRREPKTFRLSSKRVREQSSSLN